MEQRRKCNIYIINAAIIVLIMLGSCNGSGNNVRSDSNHYLFQSETINDTIIGVNDEKENKGISSVALGIKYKTKKDWNDFKVDNQEDYVITSKGLGHFLGVKDSIFIDNDGTLILEKPVIYCNYISAKESNKWSWLMISLWDEFERIYTLTGVIQINQGDVYSEHCKLKNNEDIGCVCVGRYPIIRTDSILFEIKEIYAITKKGKVDRLPLDMEIVRCPEPFETVFPEGKKPVYCYYVNGGDKHFQNWQE